MQKIPLWPDTIASKSEWDLTARPDDSSETKSVLNGKKKKDDNRLSRKYVYCQTGDERKKHDESDIE